jgi:uncharacterized membrane protein
MLWLKLFHILLAMVAVGYNASYGLWLALASKGSKQELLFALRGIRQVDRVANWAYLLLALTGLGLVHLEGLSISTLWVWLALVILIVALGLTHGLYTPTLKKQIAVLEKSSPESPEYQALAKRAMTVGLGLMVAVFMVLYLMVFKRTAA